MKFKLCRCKEPCRCIAEDRAVASAAQFLSEKFRKLRCDHEAVSCCVRCNILYLVTVADRLDEGTFHYVEETT